MDIEERLNLIRQVGEEIVTEEDLVELLKSKPHPIAYDGFEPSGHDIHIAQGIMRAINVNKMTKAGVKFKMLVADWHGWANNKMGGDLEKIQTVGHYFVEVWKACGMDLKNVEFVWASELLNNRDYWKTVMQVARHSTVKRILRTVQIMGRSESDSLQASHILYPCMQAADIFHLKADICQLGMDQRKVNMLAREIGPSIGYWKPVIISHHMLMGLGQPETVKDEKIVLEIGQEEPILDKFVIELSSVDDPSTRRRKIGGMDFNIALKLIQGVVYNDETIAIVCIKDKSGKLLEEVPVCEGKSTTTKTGIAIKCLKIDRTKIDNVDLLISSGKLQLTANVKMSKSKPDTAIFMTDSEEDIKRKMKKAWCPEGEVAENPVLEYFKYIIFEKFDSITIERPEKFGGNLDVGSYKEFETLFAEKKIHP
ncbi:MAG TPA: tyrosine--tRNA ligase, partial [Candidatus Nanoarchaeia archaeon]|nr:tyrosine--tRNA ligase [Candidatus Nanoarchaeia archaeon]